MCHLNGWEKNLPMHCTVLIKNANSEILNNIVRVLLGNLEDEPIKTRHGFIMHFKQSGHSTNLMKTFIMGQHEAAYLKFIIQ